MCDVHAIASQAADLEAETEKFLDDVLITDIHSTPLMTMPGSSCRVRGASEITDESLSGGGLMVEVRAGLSAEEAAGEADLEIAISVEASLSGAGSIACGSACGSLASASGASTLVEGAAMAAPLASSSAACLAPEAAAEAAAAEAAEAAEEAEAMGVTDGGAVGILAAGG